MPLELALIRAYSAMYSNEPEEALDKRVLAPSDEVLPATPARDHVASLAGTRSEISGSVMPLFDAMNIADTSPAQIQRSEARQASAAILLRDVQQLDRDEHQLFSVTSEKVDEPSVRAQRLRTALARVSRKVTADRMFERIFQ
jgi:hypothetical protein